MQLTQQEQDMGFNPLARIRLFSTEQDKDRMGKESRVSIPFRGLDSSRLDLNNLFKWAVPKLLQSPSEDYILPNSTKTLIRLQANMFQSPFED